MKEKIHYEVITQKVDDSDDVLIPLPPALLTKLGWKEGDTIQIALDANGKYILTKS